MLINMGTSDFNSTIEKFGRKSTIVAEASVVIDTDYGTLTLSCPIWKSLSTTKDGSTQITTEPGLPKNVSFGSDDELDAFKAAILDECEQWQMFATLDAKAEYRLTSIKPAQKGKLVKTLTRQAETPTSHDGNGVRRPTAESQSLDA
jgi:hypothetical protein